MPFTQALLRFPTDMISLHLEVNSTAPLKRWSQVKTGVYFGVMVTDERTTELCRLVRLVVASIVDDETSVEVAPVLTADGRMFIQVQVGIGDRGKLIGRGGRVAEALRQYVRAYASQHGGFYRLDIRGHG